MLVSGNGAPGAATFRREKYVPKGGPDGGDGGNGGNVIFRSKRNLSSLSHLYAKKIVTAKNGKNGSGRRRHGKNGEDAILEVPIGTLLKDQSDRLIKDFDSDKVEFLFLKGGLGGKGNYHFKSAVNQTPTYAQKGLPGEEVPVKLEIKLIADLGLVGFPNVGKSTFINCVTNSNSKIGNYPFTTRTPNLGIYQLDIQSSIIIADIPGIIKGAHKGLGLGLEFLKHIERTSTLFYFIDSLSENPYEDYKQLILELKKHSKILSKKDFFIGLSRVDLLDAKDINMKIKSFPKKMQKKIVPFSSITKDGLGEIKTLCYDLLKNR